jgi:hypothetical protein
MVSWFDIWVSGSPDFRVVLSVQIVAVLAQSSFERRIVWAGKQCSIESTKFGVHWICGLTIVS